MKKNFVLFTNQNPIAIEKMKLCHSTLSFDSITDQQWAEAFWATGQYITYKLQGNPQTGPFAEAFLGVTAAEFFASLAFEVLFSRRWTYKEQYSLKSQMRKAADGLMSNHKKLFDKMFQDDPAPVIESFENYSLMLVNTLTDEDDYNLDETYEQAEKAAKGDPDLLEFIHQMRRCPSYEDIAVDMNRSVDEVYNLARKLKRRLKK
jgi:hypothetical protein